MRSDFSDTDSQPWPFRASADTAYSFPISSINILAVFSYLTLHLITMSSTSCEESGNSAKIPTACFLLLQSLKSTFLSKEGVNKFHRSEYDFELIGYYPCAF